MKNRPIWQKTVMCADIVCVIGALIALTAAIWVAQPESGTYMLLRFVSWALMGVHFVFRGILNWKELRWLAVFEFGIVAFVLILVLILFLF